MGGRGGRRRDHDDPFVVVDVGSGYGCARADVAHYETDLVVHHAVGYYRALLGFTGIVIKNGLELLAVYTAGGIDVFARQ